MIKSVDESMIEIGKNNILSKITSRRFHGIKNIEFNFDFAEKLKIEERVFSENPKNEINKNNDEIKLNY